MVTAPRWRQALRVSVFQARHLGIVPQLTSSYPLPTRSKPHFARTCRTPVLPGLHSAWISRSADGRTHGPARPGRPRLHIPDPSTVRPASSRNDPGSLVRQRAIADHADQLRLQPAQSDREICLALLVARDPFDPFAGIVGTVRVRQVCHVLHHRPVVGELRDVGGVCSFGRVSSSLGVSSSVGVLVLRFHGASFRKE